MGGRENDCWGGKEKKVKKKICSSSILLIPFPKHAKNVQHRHDVYAELCIPALYTHTHRHPLYYIEVVEEERFFPTHSSPPICAGRSSRTQHTHTVCCVCVYSFLIYSTGKEEEQRESESGAAATTTTTIQKKYT